MHSKARQRYSPMVEREVVTVPSKRVPIHLVGPLPISSGFFEYLLTCVDLATRWSEAVSLKKTTAGIIVKHLVDMFSKNRFPGVIISDNGPQFVGKVLKSFCTSHGIQHTRTSVY